MPRTTFKNDMRITGTLAVTGATTLTGALTATGGITGPIVNTPGTATATAGAATLNTRQGKITTEALTTAQNANYTLTVTNSACAAADIVMVSIANGTNSQGLPIVQRVTPAAGSFVVVIANKIDTATALNGTLVVSFQIFKAA